MFRFSIRDALWLTVVVGFCVVWRANSDAPELRDWKNRVEAECKAHGFAIEDGGPGQRMSIFREKVDYADRLKVLAFDTAAGILKEKTGAEMTIEEGAGAVIIQHADGKVSAHGFVH